MGACCTRQDSPWSCANLPWYTMRSITAEAVWSSPKAAPYLENSRLVAAMSDCLAQASEMTRNSSLVPFRCIQSIGFEYCQHAIDCTRWHPLGLALASSSSPSFPAGPHGKGPPKGACASHDARAALCGRHVYERPGSSDADGPRPGDGDDSVLGDVAAQLTLKQNTSPKWVGPRICGDAVLLLSYVLA